MITVSIASPTIGKMVTISLIGKEMATTTDSPITNRVENDQADHYIDYL